MRFCSRAACPVGRGQIVPRRPLSQSGCQYRTHRSPRLRSIEVSTSRTETYQPSLLYRAARRVRRERGQTRSLRRRVASRPVKVPTLRHRCRHRAASERTIQNSSAFFSRRNRKLIKVNDSVTILKTKPSFRCPGVEVDLRQRRLQEKRWVTNAMNSCITVIGQQRFAFGQEVPGAVTLEVVAGRGDALVLNGRWSRRLPLIPHRGLRAEKVRRVAFGMKPA
ncbi:hypothetical protein HPB51_008464 [Rhipicephalus microplus]|uniref:Uncharacterized protein n=1 Tax=Rhipicephalus microplus TaxID=6941 RepID=A0A9J6ESP1_RHIMP|nr:hypothetical protein HPB51_008464 [Rhipicephalus microplus]